MYCRKQVWGKWFLCVCAPKSLIRHGSKKKKKLWKCKKKNSKVLFVEERVQNIEFGPKCCLNLPFVLKVDFCILKWILSFDFITLLAIALRTFIIPIFPLLTITPSPVTTLDFYLECYVFQFVEFEFGMSIWCHWFSGLSNSIPFMRSYLNMLINSRNCVLCDTYMWVFIFISTSIFSHMTSIGCVVRKSKWKLSAYFVRNWVNSLRHVTTSKTLF